MDLDIGVVGIGLACQQRLDLTFVDVGPNSADRLFGFRHDLRIALLLAHGDEFDIIAKRLVKALDRADRFVEMLALAHQLLRLRRIVPDRRIFRLLVQMIEALEGLIPVKDASSAGLWPA